MTTTGKVSLRGSVCSGPGPDEELVPQGVSDVGVDQCVSLYNPDVCHMWTPAVEVCMCVFVSGELVLIGPGVLLTVMFNVEEASCSC